jgi:hypothetical protein
MTLFEDTNPRELKELLGQIHNRDTALPDFQRDFVWDPNATQELIVSIAYNYPAGSLLRIRNTHNLFACREFQGAPPLDGRRVTYLVLDGQQRLTSLYQAFYGIGDHRYYLNLRKLIDGGDFEDAVFHLRANTRSAQALEDSDTQAAQIILPLSVLKGGSGQFGRWSRKVARKRGSERERIELEDALDEIEEKWVRVVDDYNFPVVTLSDSTSAEAVCTIFETLNRTGVKLSPFELLTARFWPKDVNLRQLWAKALEDFPLMADFEVDPYYLLQIVALLARSTPSCKRSDVLNLEASDIEQWWDSAMWGLGKGLEMLRDDCGVLIPRWLPYGTILIPLGATLGKLGLSGTPQVGVNKQKLMRWFWCSVFGQSYENAPNSQAAKDVVELLGWLAGQAGPPETVDAFRFDPRLLQDTTYRQRALYRGVICLLLSRGPRDFYSYDRLTGELLTEHDVEDHHIFPYAYLGRENVPPRQRDCVLNRTLIDRITNRRISDRPPSEYLDEVRSAYAEKGLRGDAFQGLLSSHELPTGPDSPLWKNDFEAFLGWRQDALWQRIKEVTGVKEASDLLSEEASA